jgi:hypothetical protein
MSTTGKSLTPTDFGETLSDEWTKAVLGDDGRHTAFDADQQGPRPQTGTRRPATPACGGPALSGELFRHTPDARPTSSLRDRKPPSKSTGASGAGVRLITIPINEPRLLAGEGHQELATRCGHDRATPGIRLDRYALLGARAACGRGKSRSLTASAALLTGPAYVARPLRKRAAQVFRCVCNARSDPHPRSGMVSRRAGTRRQQS